VRTRDLEVLANCEYVCDVGGVYDPSQKLFDHHQANYKGSFSSAGMVLKYLESTHLLQPHEYKFLNQSLIMGVDAHDNGQDLLIPGVCSFSQIVSNFTPIKYDCSEQEQTDAFFKSLQFVLGHLRRLRERFQYTQSCRQQIAECMQKYHECLFFDRSLPWLETFFELNGTTHPAKFIIMPSGEHWKLRGIPPSYQERMKVRQPLPKEWAGLLGPELKAISGISGAIFCHKGLFVSVWETKQDAIKALEYTLQQTKE